MTLVLNISPELEQRLTREAEREGVSTADYALRLIQEHLLSSDAEFKKAADRVLQKNAELYRRLA